MKHLFVPYEIAKQLKEKRFNEDCLATYDHDVDGIFYLRPCLQASTIVFRGHKNYEWCDYFATPLYQQVVDWFREKHKIWIIIYPVEVENDGKKYETIGFNVHDLIHNISHEKERQLGYPDYYEALTKAIEEALKLI